MNDPHVVALFYDIEHGDSVNYKKTKPIVRDEPAFRVKVKDKKVCFKLKEHYATESEARKAIDKYILVWELDAGLKLGPDTFEFVLSVHPFAPIFKGALYLNLHHNGNYGPNNPGQHHQSYCRSG